tara:strand:+ start:1186 stop:1473 length:288 start_codon:yes stop_codon:yes gene_type:complete
MSEETLDSGSVDPNQLELGLQFPNDPSYWNYRVVKVPMEDGEYTYGIYEVQYNVEGDPVKYSDFPIELYADSADELKNLIEFELPKALQEKFIEV